MFERSYINESTYFSSENDSLQKSVLQVKILQIKMSCKIKILLTANKFYKLKYYKSV